MAESIEDYYARVRTAVGPDGRIPVDAGEIPNWDIFPFEAEGLRLKPLEALAEAEPPRNGENPSECFCATGVEPRGLVWADERWQIQALERSGCPLILMLTPRSHYVFTSLPRELAAEMGQLMVELGAAIEALPSVARVHVSKWGDGGAHAHIFFFARPTRMPQLRGTCLALWDDFLPAVPDNVRDQNARAVVEQLVRSIGGRARGAARD